MNLLELMLKENVEWPVGAQWAVQDDDGERVKFGGGHPPILCNTGVWQRDVDVSVALMQCRASDWSTRVITSEEYQTAGGWMKWEGGGRNFESTDRVCVKFRGDTDRSASGIAYEYLWSNTGDDSDIIAYRIINQRPVQLDNPEIEPDFEPFVSIDDAQECKAEHAATSKQSAPKGSGSPILGMVLADLTNRALEGKEKYGEPLKAHNGRNALWDLYQELLDAAMYIRQVIEEQDA